MDRLREFLEAVRQHGLAEGNFLGLLHILIGRRITRADGTLISSGQSWRAAATLLKRARWNREAVREVGLVPTSLPPRDRQRFWYAAISQAGVDAPAARAAGDRLAAQLSRVGYTVGPAPGTAAPASS